MTVELKRRLPSPSRRARAAGGGLRDTLVDAAVALIARKGTEGFSLREVARRARVSEAAPYGHFADREALLAAVAERGFVELAKQMLRNRAGSPAAAEALAQTVTGLFMQGLAPRR